MEANRQRCFSRRAGLGAIVGMFVACTGAQTHGETIRASLPQVNLAVGDPVIIQVSVSLDSQARALDTSVRAKLSSKYRNLELQLLDGDRPVARAMLMGGQLDQSLMQRGEAMGEGQACQVRARFAALRNSSGRV